MVVAKSSGHLRKRASMGVMLNFVGNDPIAYVRGLPSKTEGYEWPELGIGKTFACI
jgi:hypothetical protein